MNPLSSHSKDDTAHRLASEDTYRKETLSQLAVPLEKEEHTLDPWFLKCDDKIVKYDMRELGKWKVSRVGL